MTVSAGKQLQVAIVTGAGQGIGLCIARYFTDNGVRVVIVEKDAAIGRKAKKILGGNAVFIQTDVASESSVKRMVAAAMKTFGRIDYLVNNAAIGKNVPIEKLSFSDWKKVIDTNLSAAFLCAKYCAAHLRKTRGKIVNIASTRALMSEANTEAYSTSKAGLVGLTHALAISLGPQICVNCISPGWIDTRNYTEKAAFPSLTKADHLQHPAGRVGRPEDIAAMVLHLCSGASGFITGQNFIIDGGMTKKMIYV
jgi:NAD(P)-dependent dehydrogenase (short-subunit alcohol dehydrogenase family)